MSKSGSPQTSMEEAEVGRNEGKSDCVSVSGVCCSVCVCVCINVHVDNSTPPPSIGYT